MAKSESVFGRGKTYETALEDAKQQLPPNGKEQAYRNAGKAPEDASLTVAEITYTLEEPATSEEIMKRRPRGKSSGPPISAFERLVYRTKDGA